MQPSARRSLLLAALALGLVLSNRALAQHITESPQTTPKGQGLLELDIWARARDRVDNQTATDTVWGSATVYTGVSENVDVELAFTLHQHSEIRDLSARSSVRGLGDLYLRARAKVWESADKRSALGVLPWVKIPTNTGDTGNDSFEGGLIIPYEYKIDEHTCFDAHVGAQVVRNSNDDGFVTDASLAASLCHSVTDKLSVFTEGLIVRPNESATETYGAVGLAYSLTDRISVDYEFVAGLNDPAVDTSHSIRLNWSF